MKNAALIRLRPQRENLPKWRQTAKTGQQAMNHNDSISFLYEQFEESCFSLFEGLECAVNFAEKPEAGTEGSFIAMIDAGSNDVELRLFLRMPFSVLALTYPIPDIIDIEEEKLEDWMAELSNMLIGKIKAKLLKYDIQVKIGIPESFYDVDIDAIAPEGFESKTYYFDIDSVIVEGRIYVDLLVDELDLQQLADDDETDEGELEMF